jgi:hypothetical protein
MIHRSFLASILLGAMLSSAPGPTPAEHADPVFREPFVLRLHVDMEWVANAPFTDDEVSGLYQFLRAQHGFEP